MRASLESAATTGVYGPDLGSNFGATEAPFVVTRNLQRGEIAVTKVCVDRLLGRLSDPLPRVDAYMICLLLRDLPNKLLLGRRA
jgi:AraC family transcriptional regulator